jgi:ABC-type branched-subunit amino acid transport system ATPase component
MLVRLVLLYAAGSRASKPARIMMSIERSVDGDVAPPQAAAVRSPSTQRLGPRLLKANGLYKFFGGQPVIDGVDLELRRGEVVLLRGENGSGKTTLLNVLTGNLEPDAGAIHYLADSTPRSYQFPRRWWEELNPFDHFTPEFVAREGIGRTWQDVRLFGSQSLHDNIAVAEHDQPGENPILALLALKASSRRETEVRREADAVLARLGLAGREDSSADMISLGQSKRVAIARAVAAGAKILFLDEPLAGLDQQGTVEILSLFDSLVRERDITLVIIEHVFNQTYLHHLVTTDWLLAGGKLTVSGSSTYHQRSTTLTRPAWLELLSGADAEILDEPLPHGACLTRIRRKGVFQRPPNPILEIRNLVVRRGPRTIIGSDDQNDTARLNLRLFEGEVAILQAPNGWGKSTLLDVVTGQLIEDQGDVIFNGRDLRGLTIWERARLGIRALPSDHYSFSNLSVEEALRLAGVTGQQPNGFLATKRCSNLSGGERQRVALSTTMKAGEPPLLILLDEPFSALDQKTTKELAGTVSALNAQISVLILHPKPL